MCVCLCTKVTHPPCVLRIKRAATEPRSERDESGEQEPGTEAEAPADGADGGAHPIKEQSNKDEGKTQRDQGASQEFGQQTEAVEEVKERRFPANDAWG